MRPRYYSICSSPLLHTDCIHIALSLEYFTCQIDTPTPTPIGGNTPSHDPTSTSTSSVKPPPPPVYYRKGLCTNYIYEICRSEFGLESTLLTQPAHPSTRYKLPTSTSTLSPEEGVYEEVCSDGATATNERSVVQAVAEVSLSTATTTTTATTAITNTAAVSSATAVTEKVVHVSCTPSNTTSFSPSGGAGAGTGGGRPHLRIFLKPSLTFRLPGSVGPPLILIGIYKSIYV